MGSLGRIVQQPVATGMTMAVIALALALPLFLNVLLQNTRSATAHWNQAFDLSVYLDPKAGTERAKALAKQLRARADVARRCASSPPSRRSSEFRTRSGFGKALDALDENPLAEHPDGHPDSGGQHARRAPARLRARIAALADVETVQLDTEWVAAPERHARGAAARGLADRCPPRPRRRRSSSATPSAWIY